MKSVKQCMFEMSCCLKLKEEMEVQLQVAKLINKTNGYF